jgi:hypothetical protein
MVNTIEQLVAALDKYPRAYSKADPSAAATAGVNAVA